jgi:hypothetical protein
LLQQRKIWSTYADDRRPHSRYLPEGRGWRSRSLRAASEGVDKLRALEREIEYLNLFDAGMSFSKLCITKHRISWVVLVRLAATG